ncbi:MAG: hypothetical protein II067_07455 [Agathobacter sp.]|uniref:hypothetical protein n=1 Tax=Agathobacter sp. TaxID=2021311 RepID=UPI00257C20EB|nr:hypothetical protein [Agathobacter sp.]MBQ1682029.1 hypothetical protein [Agathobacter sp.]
MIGSTQFTKKLLLIMLAIFAAVIFFDIFAWIRFSQKQNLYAQVQAEAQNAGFAKEYYVCERKNPIVLEDVEYLQFHAHRADSGEGEYDADFIVRADASFSDNAGGQDDKLILFGKDVKTIGDYTQIEVYRLDDYLQYSDNGWGVRALIITLLVGFLEMMTMVSLMMFTMWNRRNRAK